MLRRLRESRLSASLPAAVIALLASGGLVAIAGVSPIDAYKAMWTGALGSTSSLGITAVTTLPLLYAALAFAIPYRAGFFNVGVEGQIYVGGLASVVVGLKLNAPTAVHLPLAVLAGAAAGCAWALIPAWLKVWRGVNEIVSSLFLNYVAIYLSNYLLAGPLEAPNIGVAETSTIPNSARFPTLVAETKITAALFLAFVVVLIVWQLFRSPFGFSLRIIGGSRRVADYLGINVNRAILITFAISGALGGLGGTSEILGNQFFLAENFSPGWGYTGIAVAVLGGSSAWGVTLSALFFGIIGAFAEDMQFTNGLSPDFALVVQAVAVIFVLLGIQLRDRMRERSRARGSGQGVSGAVPVATTTESPA